MKFAYVCTNYNNTEFTRSAVESLSAQDEGGLCSIVIVDNCSTPKSISELKELAEEFDSVDIIFNDRNVGYFQGLNVGIRYVREKNPDIDHVVIGNNDLLFPSDFTSMINANSDRFFDFPVVSPDVVTVDGVHQNPHVIESISSGRELVYDLYYRHYYFAVIINICARITKPLTDRVDESRWEVGGPIYQGHGSVYILGPLFFAHFEELWAPSFLMGEEFFLSKQLSDKGLCVYYEPTIRVLHHCHASLNEVPGRKRWELARDAHRIYRKYLRVGRHQ